MCGIIGYTGSENVKDVLLDALELLIDRKEENLCVELLVIQVVKM